jgi:uridylate kinase
MVVISLGGSIVVPSDIDVSFLKAFRTLIAEHHTATGERFVLVIGGGAPARRYQNAYREAGGEGHESQDWIGIMATRLNAELVRHVMGPHCVNPVVYDPTGDISFDGTVLVAAGWKPGFSTDFDAVMLAERYGAPGVINLSNIEKVYTGDPKIDPAAQPLDTVSWEEFRSIVGDTWTPGGNLPFDPVATGRAAELGLFVIAAAGKNLENTRAILEGRSFIGTRIGPN